MSLRCTPRRSAWLTTDSITAPMCSTSRRVPWKAELAVTAPRTSQIGWTPRSAYAAGDSTTNAAAPIPTIIP